MAGRSVVRLNPLYKTILVCLVVIPFGAVPLRAASDWNHDWNYEDTRSDAREFAAGGFVHVRLSVGDVHIKRGDTKKISLRYTIKSRHERNVKEANVSFDVRGSDATIEFHSSSGGNTQFDVELEVPQNTNLDVHAKVGDVTVEDVEGDKDLSLGVGDVRVSNGHAGYRLVNVSTGIGDVHGDGYGETSGWLGKTLKYHGEGKYELRAHVGVGDIHLDGK
jgi:Putative adhesin